MSLVSEIEYNPEYLHVKVQGKFDLQDAKDILSASVRSAYEYTAHNVLFDCRKMTGDISTLQRYELATHLFSITIKKLGKKRSVRINFAYVASIPAFDPERFGEMVARNRGVSIITTESYEEAVNWLKEKAKASP